MTFGEHIRLKFRVCEKAPAGVEDLGHDYPVNGTCPFCRAPILEHLTNAEVAAGALEELARFHEGVALGLREKAEHLKKVRP